MAPGAQHGWLLSVGAGIGYLLTMRTNPVRASLRDGLRCLRRYRPLWLIPAGFGVAHALFNLWVRLYEAWIVPGAPAPILPWAGWQPPVWTEVTTGSLLPAAESTSALFNCVVTTFPLSALAALLFLGGWGNYRIVLSRRLVNRFGLVTGTATQGLFLLCALAALMKPLLFGGLPRLNTYLGETNLLRAGEVVNTLSFFFEYLLGVCVQIYLLLLAFAWARGLTFDFPRLRRFALRRFPSVFKWALVILAVSALGINLPQAAAVFLPASPFLNAMVIVRATRWVLTALLLGFCSAQGLLVFHNETLRHTLADALQLWRRHGWQVGWFLTVAGLHFALLAMADAFLPLALGPWTWPVATWNLLLYPLLWSFLSGWLLASWVCFYRRCEREVSDDVELIRF